MKPASSTRLGGAAQSSPGLQGSAVTEPSDGRRAHPLRLRVAHLHVVPRVSQGLEVAKLLSRRRARAPASKPAVGRPHALGAHDAGPRRARRTAASPAAAFAEVNKLSK